MAEWGTDDTGDVCESGAQWPKKRERESGSEGGGEREILTVCFMCLVENFLLKVLLILH